MRYVWDAAKDALNRRKHGLSLEDGIKVLEDPKRQEWIDDRFDYEEMRTITAGKSGGLVLIVVSTESEIADENEKAIRIISVRKAKPYEEDWFDFG